MIAKMVLSCVALLSINAHAAFYDPLAVAETAIQSKTFEARHTKRERSIPLRIYLPNLTEPAPVILFSHGLGGSRDNNTYLGTHWAKRGYVVVFVQHPGSDESVWKGLPAPQRKAAMQAAANAPENFLNRVEDIPAVIDALTTWNQQKDHALAGRCDLSQIGMSGHSFGAITTQAMAGQTYSRAEISFVEKRIDAALMMSPSLPKRGDPAGVFNHISIPCLLMTGTLDDSPLGETTAESRRKVFPLLVDTRAWQVVFDQATHMSFSERDMTGNDQKKQRYHSAILALSTAFWDAELRHDPAAKQWLNGDAARSVLIATDQWELNARAVQ